jgi:hypothetical protein
LSTRRSTTRRSSWEGRVRSADRRRLQPDLGSPEKQAPQKGRMEGLATLTLGTRTLIESTKVVGGVTRGAAR